MSEDTRSGDRSRGRFGRLARLTRLGDVPVVMMLVWAGWLAVPWSFSGLAQARAAAAEAALPPPPPAAEAALPSPPPAPAKAWGLPAPARPAATVLPAGETHQTHQTSRDAFAAQRAWIAGEVHDAAGHGLAAIAMQAGVALVTLDDDPEQARASLRAIRETSLTALAQLRTALDRLDPRPSESTWDTRPTDGGLRALVDGVRATGLRVKVQPDDPAVPARLHDAVYRVVRESLTNVLRHAGPSAATRVRLAAEPDAYIVEIVNHPAGTPGRAGEPGAGGRGLDGMRVRVAALGGHLNAGPRPDGGFRVLARFPVTGRPGEDA
ncbi:histidine kinase [Nonomuraea sp. 3-1Str]|uniref:sensor histidine kinase n=1 Tax=Nonomuraea sp. 3-1Str TaxID=2929801 RepID=UPI0028583A0A|nr:histidine kinase [Nonomuraea sp. 3-1Str]MDR8414299.1 histidine kinase [Nonomuraea sp. 3-1Str]